MQAAGKRRGLGAGICVKEFCGSSEWWLRSTGTQGNRLMGVTQTSHFHVNRRVQSEKERQNLVRNTPEQEELLKRRTSGEKYNHKFSVWEYLKGTIRKKDHV